MGKEVNPLQELFDSLEPSWVSQDETLRVDLSSLIIKHIEDQGITQKDLSEKTGVSEQTICKLVNGETNYRIDSVSKVMFALGIKVRLTEETNTIYQSVFLVDEKTTEDIQVIIYGKEKLKKSKTPARKASKKSAQPAQVRKKEKEMFGRPELPTLWVDHAQVGATKNFLNLSLFHGLPGTSQAFENYRCNMTLQHAEDLAKLILEKVEEARKLADTKK